MPTMDTQLPSKDSTAIYPVVTNNFFFVMDPFICSK